MDTSKFTGYYSLIDPEVQDSLIGRAERRIVTHASKTAIATPISGSLYQVNYVGSRDEDNAVPYEYLRELSRKGYEVRVKGLAGTSHSPHTIFPTCPTDPLPPSVPSGTGLLS